ncbi:MAG: hypothetical protein U9O86_02800 [Campylobacterota bacterium]|nr:hypothetical protein [Campylobacterota bacterium]
MKTILTSLMVLFSACSTPHIKNINDTLQITSKEQSLISDTGKVLYESRVNLVNINVLQKVYKMSNGSILTYEDASLSTGYIYSYGMSRTVGLIFPQYNTELLDTQANMYFFKLSNEKDTLYMILENMNKKRIKLLYGFTKESFTNISKSIVNNKEINITSAINPNKSISYDSYVKSRWNSKNIILDTIITKMGGRSKLGI